MLDFGALPPEVNSARMYAGPGSGPMMAAAAAWDALAGQLDSFGAGYSAVISWLHGQSWSGAASLAMTSAAAPYVEWATTTAARAEHAAGQARTAAAGYEMAFAATVPPAVVAANRSQLAMLVATNFFGQNTMAIAANEAAYAEMWAQDAAAMYGYAASASAATVLTPFRAPPQTTSPAGQSAQAAAVAHAAGTATGAHTQSTLPGLTSTVPHQLHTLSTAGSSSSTAPAASLASSPVLTAVSGFNTLTGPAALGSAFLRTIGSGGDFGQELYAVLLQVGSEAARPTSPEFTSETSTAGPGRGVVLASTGKAASVGKLSVPHNWTAATPVADSAGELTRSTGTGFRALPAWAGNPSTSTTGVMPPPGTGPMTSVGHHTGKRAFLNRERRFTMPRPAVGG